MPGMGHSKKWWDTYEAIRREGKSKEAAAKITNAALAKGARKHLESKKK